MSSKHIKINHKYKLILLIFLLLLLLINVTGWYLYLLQNSNSENANQYEEVDIFEKTNTTSSSSYISKIETEEYSLGNAGQEISSTDEPTISRIFFMDGWIQGDRITRDLLMADPDGSNITYITKATGVPAVSPDGTRLAVGCADSGSICIYETANFPDYTVTPYKTSYTPEMGIGYFNPEILLLDSVCETTDSVNSSGLFSISWSGDGTRLAYVCLNYEMDRHQFCVHSFTKDVTECYDGHISDGGFIESAEYSPIEDILVAEIYNGEMYIIDETGNLITYLGEGIEPIWSPDGEKILFVLDPSDDPGPWGLATINKDGSGFEWLVDPEEQIVRGEVPGTDYLFSLNCGLISRNCGLSWSPDGRYVTFGASIGGNYRYEIFQYDFETKMVSNITYKGFYDRDEYTLPEWGDIPN